MKNQRNCVLQQVQRDSARTGGSHKQVKTGIQVSVSE